MIPGSTYYKKSFLKIKYNSLAHAEKSQFFILHLSHQLDFVIFLGCILMEEKVGALRCMFYAHYLDSDDLLGFLVMVY